MVAYDILMLIVVVAAAFRGWQKGMAWQIASVGSLALSYFVAVQFRGPVSEMISLEPPLNRIAAVLVLFVATSIVVWLIFQSVRQSIERWKLRDFDRQMGALVGVAKGVLLAGLITLFAVSLLGESQGQAILSSKSGYQIARMLQRAQAIIPDEVQHVLAPYMERLEGLAGEPIPGAAPPNNGPLNNGPLNNGPLFPWIEQIAQPPSSDPASGPGVTPGPTATPHPYGSEPRTASGNASSRGTSGNDSAWPSQWPSQPSGDVEYRPPTNAQPR